MKLCLTPTSEIQMDGPDFQGHPFPDEQPKKKVLPMIKEFVKKFDKNRSTLRNDFRANRPSSYLDLVKRVVKILSDDEKYRRCFLG